MATANPEISKDKPSEQLTPNEIITAAAQAGQKLLQDSNSGPNTTISKPASLASSLSESLPVSGSIDKDGSLIFSASKDNSSIDGSQFDALADQLLLKLSPNSGEVTKAQLAQAMDDPSYTGQNAQVIAALYNGFDLTSKLGGQNTAGGQSTIDAADLAKIPYAKYSDAVDMMIWGSSELPKLAPNGALSAAQIKQELDDPKISATDKTMLSKVEQNLPQIENANGSVSETDLSNYIGKLIGQDDTSQAFVQMKQAVNRTTVLAEQPSDKLSLYGDNSSNPIKSINPNAVKQGYTEDCYFNASLAAVAKANPQLIENAIKTNPDGTYTVMFPGAKDEPITVTAPTQAELGLYNGSSENGTWAAVMEKAFGQYRLNNAGKFNLEAMIGPGAHTQQDAAGGTGKATDALQLLTGTTADFTAIQHKPNALAAMQNQDLAQVLTSSAIANEAITASVYGDDTGHTKDGRLLDNHEYTVMNYNPSGADGGTMTLRNPLDNQNNGIVQMSFNDFVADFDGISISR